MDQLALVVEEQLGDPQRVGEVARFDECPGRDDGDASFRYPFRAGEPVQRFPGLVAQVVTKDVGSGRVDEHPVIDAPQIRQVELRERLPGRGTSLVLTHQYFQGDKATLRNVARQQSTQLHSIEMLGEANSHTPCRDRREASEGGRALCPEVAGEELPGLGVGCRVHRRQQGGP
jgi:hypothetical protein